MINDLVVKIGERGVRWIGVKRFIFFFQFSVGDKKVTIRKKGDRMGGEDK